MIRDGSIEEVSAILHASPYVCGLDKPQMALLREEAEKYFAPAEHAERGSLRAMRESLDRAGAFYLDRLNNLLPSPNLRSAEGARYTGGGLRCDGSEDRFSIFDGFQASLYRLA